MENKNMILGILAVGLVIVSLVLAFNSKGDINVGGQDNLRNTISVSGNSEMTVSPDRAEIFISMTTEGRSAKDAQDSNKIKSESVYAALEKLGIKESEIETTQYYLSPKYRYDEKSGKSIIDGYTLSHELKVSTNNLDKVGDIIDAAVNAGANGVSNIQFTLTKEKQQEVNNQALAKASENAGDKAQGIATGLKVNLGEIVQIAESNYAYTPYEYSSRAMSMGAEMADAAMTKISPQDVNVRATVTVVYLIS